MEAWSLEILKTYGLAGLVIGVLAGVVVVLYRALAKANAARLADNERLLKIASDGTAALNAITAVSAARNEITDELGHAFERQGAALERLTDRLEFQHVAIKDELSRQGMVISATSQALQVTSGAMTDLRNTVERLREALP